MNLENQRETMRIQREEMQRASRLQTEQTFMGAHQANLNAGVLNNAMDNGINAFRQQPMSGMGQMGGVPQMPGMGGAPQMPGKGAVPQVQYFIGIIGQTSETDDSKDKWECAMGRINQEVRTGIPEVCQLLDVFEYPEMSGNVDDKIRDLLTNDVYYLECSKVHNQSVDKYEIKAGREFVYGVTRNQVLNAVAKFERGLILDYFDEGWNIFDLSLVLISYIPETLFANAAVWGTERSVYESVG